MLKIIIKLSLSLIALTFASLIIAETHLPNIQEGAKYQDVKNTLIENGWSPIRNSKILQSSLYAQELYENGMTEVKDCISMELDSCWFIYSKNNQKLEVKTITRFLKLEKINLIKRP